jgi:aminoglycoside 3-N-acetyltransferase
MFIDMVNRGIKNRFLSISPYLEITARIIYWRNKSLILWIFNHLIPPLFYSKSLKIENKLDFSLVIEFLKNLGINNGSTLLVHSSYDSVKHSRKLPREIIDDLLGLVGAEGNLLMPANRVFNSEEDPIIYNLNKTRIWSGALPFAMSLRKDAKISRFPINSVVVIGKDAEEMIINNIKEEFSTPCGRNSAWYQCYLKNAYILGLGIDLTHSLTMTHVAEDSWESEWPIMDWYEIKKYEVIDKDFRIRINVRQRREKWGKYYFAERKLAKDLERANILKIFKIQGIDVQLIRSKDLIEFLRSRNAKGYPFYGVSRFKKQ